VTRGTVTATWHDVCLTRGKFFNFLKKFEKIQKKKSKIKIKKNSKNPEANTWHPI